MERGSWSARTVLRYALLQVPGLVILVSILILARQWVDLPAWFIWALIALWVSKDVVLFPYVWRAFEPARPEDTNSMLGTRGIAEDRLAPSGYVRVRGELWHAEVIAGGPSIERGESVRVRGIRNLALLVQPEDEEGREAIP